MCGLKILAICPRRFIVQSLYQISLQSQWKRFFIFRLTDADYYDNILYMKTIILTVEVTVKVNNNIDPEDLTLDIDLSRVHPQANGKTVGHCTGYTTTNSFDTE